MSFGWTRRLQRTVGWNVALWYAAVFGVSLGLCVVVSYLLLASSLRQRDREIVVATLRSYADAYARGGLRAVAAAVEREQRTGARERLFVRVVSFQGDAVFLTMPEAWDRFAVDGLDDRGDGRLFEAPSAERSPTTLEVASARMPDGAVLQVGKSTEIRDDLLARFRQVLLLVAGIILVTGVAGGVVIARSAMQPVRRLTDAVRTIIATGRTDVRVETEGRADPLDELGVLVNAMLGRITRLVESTQDSLDNVAHDLRTPLARLRARVEGALSAADPAARADALADCLEDCDRLSAMLDTLMDIAEAQSGVMRLRREPLDVCALLRDVDDLYADAAEEKGVALALTCPEPLVLQADAARLRRALANLVDNAVKYTDAGGRVDVRGRRDDDVIVVEVRDTGAGIEAGDLGHIWARLYRGDRSRSSQGLGLGLSLVRAFVEAHGGTVEVESTVGVGATFRLRLPIAPAAVAVPPNLTQV